MTLAETFEQTRQELDVTEIQPVNCKAVVHGVIDLVFDNETPSDGEVATRNVLQRSLETYSRTETDSAFSLVAEPLIGHIALRPSMGDEANVLHALEETGAVHIFAA